MKGSAFGLGRSFRFDIAGQQLGIFKNKSVTSPESHGYYVFNIEFNNISWAASHNCGYKVVGQPETIEGTDQCVGNPAWPDEFGGKK